jgi:three-Cys-motif partner protein
LDQVGYWTEVKLDIVRKYAQAYSTIMNRQASIRSYLYIDAFAGAGVHISRRTNDFIPGSPLNALNVNPPFREYHFVDINGDKAAALKELAGDDPSVFVYTEDSNQVLPKIFARATFEAYKRALCILDPYGLHLHWSVIRKAGEMRSIEIFLNFPILDMQRNVLLRNPLDVKPDQLVRMDAFWGDRKAWQEAAYRESQGLFDVIQDKTASAALAEAFRQRLQEAAGFEYVPAPMPMRNSKGNIVYYLFFASPNKTGAKIVKEIFDAYRNRGLS